MKRRIIFFLIINFIFLSSIGIQAQTPINVYVSILPLKYFVQRIGGERVNVTVMVGPGQSPETYAPQPKQMQQLSKTKIYYRVDVPFEQAWMHKIVQINPYMQVVDLRQGIKLRHLGTEMDPHIWTDPILVMHMTKTIRDSLSKIDPAGKQIYQQNYVNFNNDLKKLDQQIRTKLNSIHNRTFLVFHPAWGYFAAQYGLQQIAIASEGKTPGPQDLAKIINTAKAQHIKVILVQTQFSKTQAQMIANAIHAKVVTVDPLAENYLANMYKIADIFAKYLGNE